MANLETCLPLTRPSVIVAHEIVKPYIHFTPVLTNNTITALASTPQEGIPNAAKPKLRLWFKCENLQKVGAFKARGAFHALKHLIAEEGLEKVQERGVVTHSSGQPPSLTPSEMKLKCIC
jgi:threonine dehydratase